jgi:hypothetical protein
MMLLKRNNVFKLTVVMASEVLLLMLALPSMAQVTSNAPGKPGSDPLMTPMQSARLNGTDFSCNANFTESCVAVTRLDPKNRNDVDKYTRSVLAADKYVFVLFSTGLLRRCLPHTIYNCTAIRRCWPQTTYSCTDFGDLKAFKFYIKRGGAMAVLREGTIIVGSSTNMVRTADAAAEKIQQGV